MAKQGFSKPKLHNRGGDMKKEWYVQFYFTCPVTGVRKPFPLRRGINYLHTKQERTDEGNTLADLAHDCLKEGWNPFQMDIESFLQSKAAKSADLDYHKLPLKDALIFGLEQSQKKISHKSHLDYEKVVNFALQAAKKRHYDHIPVAEIKRKHMRILLDQMGDDRQAAYDAAPPSSRLYGKKFSGNSYNRYKRYLGAIFTELEEVEAVEFNPISKISDREEINTNQHRHATAKEEQLIKDCLKEKKPKFYIYLAIETLSGLRPNEIQALRVCDIDWFNQCFDQGADEGKSKTKQARKVAIPNTLMPLIHQLELEKYDPNDFIFSRGFEPGPVMMHRNNATALWKKLIIDGLGLKVTLYSFKGLGGEKKRAAGIDKVTVASSYGHRNLTTTDIYLHGEDERKRQDIINNTPEF